MPPLSASSVSIPAALQKAQGVRCPSCSQAMEALLLENKMGQALELDVCFACHGIWFDQWESAQLSPSSVHTLFKALHAHNDQPRLPLKNRMFCPRCPQDLTRGEDRTINGTYVVYRCPQRHGRFGTFSSFMVEKGFVRQLNRAEIAALAEKVKTIHCNNCGATVDLRKDHACPFCRAAFSLLDPQAVEKALARYGSRAAQPPADVAAEVILASERIQRENRKAQQERRMEDWISEGELWSAGLAIVWKLLRVLLK